MDNKNKAEEYNKVSSEEKIKKLLKYIREKDSSDILETTLKIQLGKESLSQGLTELERQAKEFLDREELANRIILDLKEGDYGDPIPSTSQISTRDFILWILKTPDRFAENEIRSQDVAFLSKVKLHKICFFIREFKFPSNIPFVYWEYPYGVYSPTIDQELNNLRNEGYLKIHSEKGLEREYSSSPSKIVLTNIGSSEADNARAKFLVTFSHDEVYKAERMITRIYRESAMDLGMASKLYFANICWYCIREYSLGELYDFLETELPANIKEYSHFIFNKIELFINSKGRIHEHFKPGYDLQLLMYRHFGKESFNRDKYYFFGSKKIPTNYFFPVEFIREHDFLKRRLVEEILIKIRKPEKIKNILFLYNGLPEEIGKILQVKLSKNKTNIKLIGPAYDRNSDQDDLINLSIKNGDSYIILTDTLLTGDSVVKAFNYIKEKNSNVLNIVTIADRGLGAVNNIKNKTKIFPIIVFNKNKIQEYMRTGAEPWYNL